MIGTGYQRGSEAHEVTCYTSPDVHVTYIWPSGFTPYLLALYFFACIFLGVMTVWCWWHFKPCDTCGEYRPQCRCKGRDYYV